MLISWQAFEMFPIRVRNEIAIWEIGTAVALLTITVYHNKSYQAILTVCKSKCSIKNSATLRQKVIPIFLILFHLKKCLFTLLIGPAYKIMKIYSASGLVQWVMHKWKI